MRLRTEALVLAIVLAAGTAFGQQVSSDAHGIVRVLGDPQTGLTNQRLLQQMLLGQPLLKAAVKRVSKAVESEPLSKLVRVEVDSKEDDVPQGVAILSVKVFSLDERVEAEKVLRELVGGLLNALYEEDTGRRLDERRLNEERERVQKLAAELEQQSAALAVMAQLHKVETNAAMRAQRKLQIEAQYYGVDAQLQGIKARQAILEKQIAQRAKNPGETEQDKAVLVQLMKSIDARRRIVEYQQAASNAGAGGASVATLEKANDELAQAEAELAKFRQAAAGAAGGQRIAELKARLDDTAIELAELTAKREVLEREFEKASGFSSQVELKRIDVELLEREYRLRAEEAARLEEKVQQYRSPTVTLIPLD